jgi:hypothetical protein
MFSFIVLLQGWLAVLFILALAVIATQNEGRAWVDFDRYGEMWFEVGVLGAIGVGYPFALWRLRDALKENDSH